MMENIYDVDVLNDVPSREATKSLSILHFSIADGSVIKIKVRFMVILSSHVSRKILMIFFNSERATRVQILLQR